MFGKDKKKKEQVKQPQRLDTVPFQSAVNQGEGQTQPLQQQIEQQAQQEIAPIQPPQPEAKAKIIGCELDPETGLWKFTFVSNAPMGEMGQEFDI